MEILGKKLLNSRSSGTGIDFMRSWLSLLQGRGGRCQSKWCSSSDLDLQVRLILTGGGGVWVSCPLRLPFSPQDLRNTLVIAL